MLFDLEINRKVQLRRSPRLLSKEKRSSRIPSNQLTNVSTSRKKSKNILVEFDNNISSVSILYVGLFVCIIMPGITFPCLEQSVKLVNLLLSYIAGHIIENKGCVQFNCKEANIDFFLQNLSKLQVSMKNITFLINPFSAQGEGGIHRPEQMFFVTSEPIEVLK